MKKSKFTAQQIAFSLQPGPFRAPLLGPAKYARLPPPLDDLRDAEAQQTLRTVVH